MSPGPGPRVAVTGLGLVTPLATGTRASWEALLSGASGTGPITRFDASAFRVRAAAQVGDLDETRHLDARDLRHMDRYCVLAVVAADLAVEDAGLDEGMLASHRSAVVMGVGLGGLETLERMKDVLDERGPRFLSPWTIPMIIPNMASGWISMRLGLGGPSLTAATACASGAHAVAEACALLARGDADLVLAGGAEAAVTPMGVGGFAAMRALSTRDVDPARASCPFDERRDGFVVGEGAGVLVLEREHDARRRGGRILALVTGSASTSDAWDPTQPDPEGHGALRAMRTALEDAGRDPGDVGWINAHATSTPLGDRAEALAIRRLVGDGPVPVSSTKGATGHLLGAAGAVEAAFTALALAEGRIPATTNLERPDPDCDLDLVAGAPREADLGCAITNAFGFGGTNVTLVMERGDGT